ncbi:MAG: FAD-dependent oxidoreductase, partial [Armatimonadota bacterium]
MPEQADRFPHVKHEADFCIIGGGMAGICAALAAARRGARVVLMHDRPVLGGNASSECRVPICGADRAGQIPYLRETGILEELRLDNLRRNPHRDYSIWDLILYEKVQYQPNLTLLLNCSCFDAAMTRNVIQSVTGWQLTTHTYHTVAAKIFADCSGDAVLAPLTGHPFRMGREARREHGESIAPEAADDRTMGMTCFIQARQHESPQPFQPPSWAYRYHSAQQLPFDQHGRFEIESRSFGLGYWWVELGGEQHSIHDTETIREELLRIALGVWDHIKNRGDYDADNWALEWIQFLPAKRESRRYLGAHVLTQNDLESEGRFDDLVAYGGWTMDDHHPAGFNSAKLGAPATIYHPTPSPYGIPYRSLYSDRLANLMFAGRCHSATHSALSSTRVMGTCSSMGQAVGTAAALAVARGLAPAGVLDHIAELQQTLFSDDCYLPWIEQQMPGLTCRARLSASQGDPEP